MDKLVFAPARVLSGVLRPAGCLLIAGLAGAPAMALELSGYVEGGVTHTDNSQLTDTNEISDKEYGLDSMLQLAHRGSKLNLTADYALDHTEFQDDSQDATTELEGNGRLSWQLVPALNWDLRHMRSTELADRRQANTADNRETREILATGPRMRLPVTDHDFLNGSVQLMDVRDDASGDSARETVSTGWTRLLSPTLELTADLSHNSIDYDLSTSDDVQLSRATLTGIKRHRLGRMELTAGRNKSERDQGDTSYGGYYRGYADYNAGGHVFSFAGVQELTDSSLGIDEQDFGSSDGMGVVPDDNFEPENSNFDVVDVVERRSLEINYSTQRLCDQCEVRIRAVQDEQDFELQLRDEREIGAMLSFGYRWSELFQTELSYGRDKTEFLDDPTDREDDTDQVSLEARWQFSRAWWLVSELAREKRDSTSEGSDYVENRVGLSVRYEFELRGEPAAAAQ